MSTIKTDHDYQYPFDLFAMKTYVGRYRCCLVKEKERERKEC